MIVMVAANGRPRDWLAVLAARLGEESTAAWCAELITEAVPWDDREHPSLEQLAGAPGRHFLDRAAAGDPEPDYWPRVWGARGLLYVWCDDAEPAVLSGLTDERWRVREMCAKVVRLRGIGAAAPILSLLLDDEVARVRAAALRALDLVDKPGKRS